MTKPHKHAALIKLWADGAVIECLHRTHGTWAELDAPGGGAQPAWFEDFEYRVKPEPVLSDKAYSLINDLVLTFGEVDDWRKLHAARDKLSNFILNLEQKVLAEQSNI